MANLIQNNSKLVSQVEKQTPPTIMQNNKRDQTESERQPKTIRIIKDQSGFGFNVRGQISGEFCNYRVNHSVSIFLIS